jgi:hypothetical protein
MAPKKTKFLAFYQAADGTLHEHTRTSTHSYRFVSVVRWSDGDIAFVKWSATEAGARSCLTAQQKASGATVIAVVPAVPQPDLTAAEQMFGSLLPHPQKES